MVQKLLHILGLYIHLQNIEIRYNHNVHIICDIVSVIGDTITILKSNVFYYYADGTRAHGIVDSKPGKILFIINLMTICQTSQNILIPS